MTAAGADSIFKQRGRHCERSEAIHFAAKRKNGLLRRFAPRNDGEHKIAFSRRDHARVLARKSLPSKIRGRGECRVPNAPAASCALGSWSMHTSIHSGGTGNIRHSPRNGFNSLYVLSPGTGLFCPRHSRGIVSHENLAPASGRQDHTPSPSALAPLVLRRIRVHRIPPHVRDDAYAPLAEAGQREEYTISDFQKVKYLCVAD